ncbi:MAG: hypothetical protein RL885_08015 [Planctomycetota bacterium]
MTFDQTLRRLLIVTVFLSGAPLLAQVDFGDVEYQKLDTRAATERRMLDLLSPQKETWGEWYLLTPFSYRPGRDDLARELPPEEELTQMKFGGPGPDLDRAWTGERGMEVRWQPLGEIGNRPVNLAIHRSRRLNDNSGCYLYGTVRAESPHVLELTMGSDDGLRFWLNGKLLVDKDVPRSLDPDADTVRLPLQAGVNHVLAKVVNGGGDWQYQINYRPKMDPLLETKLQYQLDLDFPPHEERRFWQVLTYPLPEDVVLEVGGLDILPDGRPVVCTRRSDIWIVDDAWQKPPFDASYQLFASGLHEPLGVAAREEDGQVAIYCVQRGELTRLVDEDGDDVADLYETFCDDWGVSGNYHEFAFGPKFDREGNAWVTLNVGFCGSLGKSVVPYRGWALKVTPDGEMIPVCGGMRSPNGIGMWTDGEMFYVDNQGDYIATNRLAWLREGSWHGHPSGLRWREGFEQGDPEPVRQPTAVWFPYNKMGQSTADVVLAETEGRFGPFEGQIFVGDQTRATVMRVTLERLGDVYQGACYPFAEALQSGVNRIVFAPDGSMLVGQTDRGWGSVGKKRYGLQRLVWTGEVPFEVKEMRAHPKGFELEFTRPFDKRSALAPSSYRVSSYTYLYHATYGSPEVENEELEVLDVKPIDAKTVLIQVEGLREGFVHELHYDDVRSKEGQEPLHAEAYYTLQVVPK